MVVAVVIVVILGVRVQVVVAVFFAVIGDISKVVVVAIVCWTLFLSVSYFQVIVKALHALDVLA